MTEKQILEALKAHNSDLRKYSVKRIGLFGSYARGEQRPDSDVDFLVEFDKSSFDNFMELSFYLESLLGTHVDLITPQGLSPYLKPYIERELRWYEAH
jgi:predicted nucleotidyltransferase